jgi:hypothetical protein
MNYGTNMNYGWTGTSPLGHPPLMRQAIRGRPAARLARGHLCPEPGPHHQAAHPAFLRVRGAKTITRREKRESRLKSIEARESKLA